MLALITMMGWKLGMIESVSLTILAGFSVDFCVRGFHGALLGIPKRVLSVDHSRFIWLTLITQAVSLHGALACCGCKSDVQCCHGLIRATAGLPVQSWQNARSVHQHGSIGHVRHGDERCRCVQHGLQQPGG